MKLTQALAVGFVIAGASACSNAGGETLVVHIKYSNEDQLVGNAITANFDICRKDRDNFLTLVVDDLPPGATIPNSADSEGDPNLPLKHSTTYKCADLLED